MWWTEAPCPTGSASTRINSAPTAQPEHCGSELSGLRARQTAQRPQHVQYSEQVQHALTGDGRRATPGRTRGSAPRSTPAPAPATVGAEQQTVVGCLQCVEPVDREHVEVPRHARPSGVDQEHDALRRVADRLRLEGALDLLQRSRSTRGVVPRLRDLDHVRAAAAQPHQHPRMDATFGGPERIGRAGVRKPAVGRGWPIAAEAGRARPGRSRSDPSARTRSFITCDGLRGPGLVGVSRARARHRPRPDAARRRSAAWPRAPGWTSVSRAGTTMIAAIVAGAPPRGRLGRNQLLTKQPLPSGSRLAASQVCHRRLPPRADIHAPTSGPADREEVERSVEPIGPAARSRSSRSPA